ncbi:Nucleolar complex protein 2 -like protein [Triplophysa tibetana]|uniref:Nucleolar complex protein 2-like protein n=1 Tax=Triplophysa tibetana TaxID=1572043 RepID=A0A5A9NDE9_9TELE|nr:Nucleolar complex protein 2 -like protein [Triplophysa tibetana]
MAGKNKRKLGDLSVDEFLTSGFDFEEDGDSHDEDESTQQESKIKKSAPPKKSVKKQGKASEHKDQLSELKCKDPEFFKFLEDNDQTLLNFEDSDSDDAEDEEERMYHKLPSQLEDANYDDSEEKETDKKNVKKTKKSNETIKVTEAMIENWRTGLTKEPTSRLFRDITQAFKAAVATTKGESDEQCRYTISESTVFNSLILFCIKEMHAVLNRMLNLRTPEKDHKKLILPSSSPRWHKHQIDIKMYIAGVVQLLSSLTQSTVIDAVLRHAHQMVPFYLCLPKQCRILVKNLIRHWSTGEETVRVLAFLSLNKICRHKPESHLNNALKQMYIAYVKNCKFTSPNALPMISFMQRTLTEMYSLETQVSYQQAFIYIRQLAIHLRSAMNMKKKDTYQSVYNWQYVHCLHLWCRVLSTIHPSEVLEPLIYPLCQVIIGCIKLVPISRYYPLRLHCTRALILLSANTKTFVPVLPFLVEILQQEDFNKKPGRISLKPINFAVILKLSKINLQEKAYKDGLLEQLYDLILEYFHTQACSIGFPELALPTIIQLKAFLKECKVANYCKQMRQLLEKIKENCNYITGRRQKAVFGVSDTEAVVAWEKQVAEEGTPLTKYFSQWKKLRERQIQLEISGKDRMEDLNLPEIKRKKAEEKKLAQKEFKGLLESDSEDDSNEDLFKSKGERADSGDDEGLEDLSDLSDEDDDDASEEIDDSDEDHKKPSSSKGKAPRKMLSTELYQVAQGDDDMVEDLELSDQD